MSLEIVVPPEIEPISLAQARDHIRGIETATGVEDPDIEGWITTAREHLDGRDGILGRQLLTATWDYTLDRFPCGDELLLPLAPVQSITSITYTDTDGVSQTFSSSNYSLSADKDRRPRIDLGYGATWPGTRNVRDAVTVRFVAGYGDGAGSIPGPIISAMLLHIGALYDNRSEINVGNSVSEIPKGAERLLASYMRRRFV